MRKLVMAAVALMMMSIVGAPSASAQEMKKMDKSHWLKGTMTPPDQETREIAYEVTMGEEGLKGWIVAEREDGEKVKIEMRDLSMDGDYVNYNWSLPGDSAVVITCSLNKQADGGFAGDCTEGGDDAETGQMTIAPMEGMNPCAANPCAAEMNPCSG